VHFADLVRQPGVKQNPLGSGGFAGINVGDYAEIAIFFKGSWRAIFKIKVKK